MKKMLSIVLVAMFLVAMLSGCGGPSGADTDTPDPGQEGSPAAAEPEKIVMAFMSFAGPQPGQKEVEEAINAITRERIGVEVEFIVLDMASYAQQITLMLSGNEKVDVFNAVAMGFTPVINNGYVLDLEENDLIQTYGQGILETMGEYVDGCRFNGRLYGLPQNRDLAAGMNGFAIVSEYLDGIGYEHSIEDVNPVTWEELNDIFAQLHAQYPDKNVFAPIANVAIKDHIVSDGIGGDYFGALMDPANSLEISNLFASPEYLDMTTMYYDWNQAGYISGDALANSHQSHNEQVIAGTAMAFDCSIKPGIIQQETDRNQRQMAMFQVGNDAVLTSSVLAAMPWCISANTEYPEAAMKLLNEFYTDPELSQLLCYGVDGKHVTTDADGFLTYPEGVTADTVAYHPNVPWLMPNEYIAGVWEGNDPNVWEDTDAMNEAAIYSKAIGFTFDNSAVSSEYTALMNVYNEYQIQLEFGFIDPQTGIDEMLSRMEGAGLDDYMAEKQRQLDAWAELAGVN